MNPSREVCVAVVDAAYDFHRPTGDWLRRLLASGGEAFDHGLGCVGALIAGVTHSGEPLVSRVVALGPSTQRLTLRFARGLRSLHMHSDVAGSPPVVGHALTLSGCQDQHPEIHERVLRHVKSKDVLALVALDAELHGVIVLVPLPVQTEINRAAQKRWLTIVSHIAAADRMRRALGLANHERLIPLSALAGELAAEELASPSVPPPPPAPPRLRDAAMHADRSQQDAIPEGPPAPEVLRGVVDGRWSLVDWFDSDGRRFYLARPNGPDFSDPRALTAKEREVALCAARGESGKLTSYRLGISATRVSSLLRSAMRKLGAKTAAELVVRVRCLETHAMASEN